MQVSIRELKIHLSQYFHLAQQEERAAVEGVKWGRDGASFLPLDIQPGKSGKTIAEMVSEDRG